MIIPHSPLPASSPTARRHRALRRAWWIAVFLAGTVVLSTMSAAAAVYLHQHASLDGARSDRAAAQGSLEAALSRAGHGGVEAARLAPIVARERAVLAEPEIVARFHLVDQGEADHLQHQTATLHVLVREVRTAQTAATEAARHAASPLLDRFDAAIAAAHAAGLDTEGHAALAAALRTAVASATLPGAVDDATGLARMTADDLDVQTKAKVAADAAAAAAAAFAESKQNAAAALSRADQLVAQAQQQPALQIAGFVQAITTEHQAITTAVTQADFDAVTQATRAASGPLAQLLSDRGDAYAAMAQGRQTVNDATSLHLDPGGVPSQLDGLQPQLNSAGTSPQFTALTAQIQGIVAPLQARVIIAELGSGKVILISLSGQTLTAYQDGNKLLTTYITTGRPSLPTPPGVTSVLRKNHPWHMVSDWPQSSPYWYPPSWVQYTLWFREGGYAIHDAPWRSSYGPGTQAYGSHGCVNVPMPTMTTLYNWAEVGTKVIVLQ